MALKVAVLEPAATVMDVGVVSSALLLESPTAVPPVGAALVRVTVQVLVALGPRLVGLQATEDKTTGATRLTVALCETVLSVAVTTAL